MRSYNLSDSVLSLGLSLGPKIGAAVLMNSKGIVASAVEEKWGARKPTLPLQAIQFCLTQAGLPDLGVIDVIGLQTRHAKDWVDFIATQFTEEKNWIEGLLSFPTNLRHELKFRAELKQELARLGGDKTPLPDLQLIDDEQAIASGLFLQRPPSSTAYLLMDIPFLESATGLWGGQGSELNSVWINEYPQSLELLLANLAGFCGFRGRMGHRQFLQLAEYGEPRFVDLFKQELFFLEQFGQFKILTDILSLTPNRETEWEELGHLFEEGPRRSEQPISSREIDIAHAMVALIQHWGMNLVETLNQDLGLSEVVARGHGPLFDKLKILFKKMRVPTTFVGQSDEALTMAAGAARESLKIKNVEMTHLNHLNLRPDSAFQEYNQRSGVKSLYP